MRTSCCHFSPKGTFCLEYECVGISAVLPDAFFPSGEQGREDLCGFTLGGKRSVEDAVVS